MENEKIGEKESEQFWHFKSNETKIGVFIIVSTIVIYHFISFETEIMKNLPKYVSNTALVFLILPGVISTIIFLLIIKKIKKAVLIGFITTICWLIWFILYIAATWRVH